MIILLYFIVAIKLSISILATENDWKTRAEILKTNICLKVGAQMSAGHTRGKHEAPMGSSASLSQGSPQWVTVGQLLWAAAHDATGRGQPSATTLNFRPVTWRGGEVSSTAG